MDMFNEDIKSFLKNKTIIKLDKTQEAINDLNNDELYLHVVTKFRHFFVKDGQKIRQNKNIIFNLVHNPDTNFIAEQKKCLIKMMQFVKNSCNFSFGLYGFAGTGKTTLLIEFVAYLLQNKYINSVVFSAPTNKAVNVMKSKFHPKLEKIIQMFGTTKLNFDDKLEFLEQHGIKIHFITIHKLLMYQTDYTISGEIIFNRTNKNISLLDDYQLAVIDECSMIASEMANALLDETAKHTTKVIFSGDSAQLPPVNEKESIIFGKTSTSFLLTNVMRSHLDNVIAVCTKFRLWNIQENVPNISENMNKDGVFVYNSEEWFNTFTKKIKNKENAVILTWTNKATDAYNLAVRQHIFGSKQLKKYEKNDILILAEFYNIASQKIYTSEQIVVKNMEYVSVPVNEFNKLNLKTYKLLEKIEKNVNMLVTGLNEKYCKNVSFASWILNAEKTEECKTTTLIVIDDVDIEKYNKSKNESSDILRNFVRKLMEKTGTFDVEQYQKQVEHHIAQPLWKQWHKIFVNPFANVNYGYSITCHKAQGSTLYDVFVDLDDIFQNGKFSEAQKCAYTAITRASNELHILL